jgi:hypothetical protein
MDGAELFRVLAAARSQADMNPEFGFEIAFGEPEVIEGEPLFPTLPQYVQLIQGILEPFRPLF